MIQDLESAEVQLDVISKEQNEYQRMSLYNSYLEQLDAAYANECLDNATVSLLKKRAANVIKAYYL